MAHHRSRRHRDEAPPAYDPYDAYPSYEAADPYAAYAPRRGSSAGPAPRSPPPSRRHKSERRRAPSPNYYSDAPFGSSRSHDRPSRRSRHDGRYEPAEPVYRGRSAGPDQHRRYASPSPEFDKPRRSRTSRSHRDKPRQIEPAGYGAYDQDLYARDAYARDPRSRYSPEPRDSHKKSHNRHRSQPSDDHRQRGRSSRHLESDEDNHYFGGSGRGRRQPSRDRDTRQRGFDDRSPSRGRRGSTRDRGHGDRSRRQSMPATTKAKKKAVATANAKVPWWQNPMIQAGARTAFTAGAQAAMKSSSDKSPWLGPKGAKVATAAIGAALVDGFMGQKYPNSTRQKLAREGVDFATTHATNDVPSYKRRH